MSSAAPAMGGSQMAEAASLAYTASQGRWGREPGTRGAGNGSAPVAGPSVCGFACTKLSSEDGLRGDWPAQVL